MAIVSDSVHAVPEFNPRLHGTVTGSGVTDDAPAIQAALDEHRLVYLPQGKYRIASTLILHSHNRLRLHPAAEIFFDTHAGRNAHSFLATNEPHASDIHISGGVWNGNAPENSRGNRGPGEPPEAGAYTGIGISFQYVDGLFLSDMTIRDTVAFHIRIHGVKNFIIEHITFDDMLISSAQDGIHVGGCCENGVIRHIHARGSSSPNDDMISLIADFDQTNMWAEDPLCGYSQLQGDIRNIRIYDIEADNAFSFVRLLSEKYTIENIDIEDVRGGCYYLALELQVSPYLRHCGKEHLGTGHIRNVRVSHWNVFHRYVYASTTSPYTHDLLDCNGLIDVEQRIENLVIENFHRDMDRDAFPNLPTLNYKSYTAADIILEGTAGTRLLAPEDDLEESKLHDPQLPVIMTFGPTRSRVRFCTSDEDRFAVDGNIAYLKIDAK